MFVKKILPFFLCFNLLVSIGHEQKFYFDNGKAPAGAIRISPASIYNDQTGYGFEAGAALKEVRQGIGSEGPFFFSVKLPEGNYNVNAEISSAVVRAECRRLMVQDTRAASLC